MPCRRPSGVAAASARPGFRAKMAASTRRRHAMPRPAPLPATTMPDHRPGRGRIYDSITDTIGDTPIVRLDRIAALKEVRANLLAKLEFFNPIHSVKDRIGVAMIDALEANGRIRPGVNT